MKVKLPLIETPNDEQLAWEKQENEADDAYYAFKLYISLHTRERTVMNAYKLYCKLKKLDIPEKIAPKWNTWFKQNNWAERAKLYDIDYKSKLEAYAAQDQVYELIQFRKSQRALANTTLHTAIDMIQAAAARLKTLDPNDIPAAVLPQYLKAAAAIAEMASDAEARALMLTDIVEAYEQNFSTKDDIAVEEIDENVLEDMM